MSLSDKYPAYGGEGPVCLRLGLALGAIATILMILRAYVRLRVNDIGGWALFWTTVAWAATTTTQTVSVFSMLYGLGNHIDIVIETGQLSNFLFFTWLTFFFFNLAVPLGKVAICAFLLEVESKTRPGIRWTLIGIATVNVVVAIPQVLLCWLQCSPVSSLWDPERQADCNHHINANLTYFVGAVAALTDFALAIIPAFILWPLQMDRKLKIGLSVLMATGVLAGVAAIIRTYSVQYMFAEDSTYELYKLFIWGEVEEWLVIICACIPPVWPLFRPLFARFLTQASSRLGSSSAKKTASSIAPSTAMDRGAVTSAQAKRRSWRSSVGDKEAGTWMELDDDVERAYIGKAVTTDT